MTGRVVFELWDTPDHMRHARLRVGQWAAEIGNGYRLHSDAIHAIRRFQQTTPETPIEFLKEGPQ